MQVGEKMYFEVSACIHTKQIIYLSLLFVFQWQQIQVLNQMALSMLPFV